MTEHNEQQLHYFKDRYALRNGNGVHLEDHPDQMFDRVASAIANTPEEAASFRSILNDFHFVPGGRILAGAGAESEKTFYNCYVIPVETKARRFNRTADLLAADNTFYEASDPGNDSREAIFDTMATMVDIMSRGGGVGINWSVLRPAGGYLTRVSGTSSGPVGWMDVASKAVGEVEQGGSRRGAAMFMLDDWHPDVLKFIEAKKTKGKIENANISVAISDEFMECLERQGDWVFRFPDTTDPAYNSRWDGDIGQWEKDGGRVVDYGSVPAQLIWDAIAGSAHASGEPGVVFLGRYNSLSTAAGVERLISVNPCGEQGLGAYSVCNLGAMNLDAYVVNGFDSAPIFNFKDFTRDARIAVRFLDNAIDKNYYFLPETAAQQKKLRRIGLGVMGLADALVRLKVRYGSEEAVTFVGKVFRELKDAAIEESMAIAEVKGPAGAWRDSMWDRPYLAEYADRRSLTPAQRRPLRNLFLLTQAPTGTTSLLARVNSGIEPFHSFKTWREDRTGGRWIVPKTLEKFNLQDGERPDYVVNSADVSVEEHVAVQAAAQRYVDSSISKTINAPRGQTVEETKKAFTLAYEQGLKGVAYYRDGSRSVQVLYHTDPNERIAELEAENKALKAKLEFKQTPYYPKTFSVTAPNSDWLMLNVSKTTFVGHPTDCKGEVIFEEGCTKCHTCAWSAC